MYLNLSLFLVTVQPETSTPSAEATPGSTPLQSEWSFWFDRKPASHTTNYKEYQQSLVKLGSFTTMEDFWRHYSYIVNPDAIPKDYSLFLARDQVTPAWESYQNGGCWIIRVRKRNMLIDRLWEELCFACVGELFGHPDVVCVGVSTRNREDVLSVWTRTQTHYLAIGDKLKEILNLDEQTQVDYKTFRNAIRDGSSFRNSTPYVFAAMSSVPTIPMVPTQPYQQQQPQQIQKPFFAPALTAANWQQSRATPTGSNPAPASAPAPAASATPSPTPESASTA